MTATRIDFREAQEVFREHVSIKIDGVIDQIDRAKGHKRAQAIPLVPFLEASIGS